MDLLVSVVIPSYGRDQRLNRAVESVVDQTHDNIELLIVDDYSPIPVSDTLDPSYRDENWISILRHETNRGANAARTTGMKAASGEYIAFLDDDDEWRPSKIEKQLDRANATGAEVIYTWVSQVVNGSVVGGKTANHTNDVLRKFFQGDFIGTFSAIMIRSSVVDEAGYPDPKFPSWQDWDYFIRLADVADFVPVTEPLVLRHSEGQDRISDDYYTKQETSARLLRDKHEETAEQYSLMDEFNAIIEHRLGSAAMSNEEWKSARSHFVTALRKTPKRMTFVYLVSVIGGPITFYPLQKLRRAIVSMR